MVFNVNECAKSTTANLDARLGRLAALLAARHAFTSKMFSRQKECVRCGALSIVSGPVSLQSLLPDKCGAVDHRNHPDGPTAADWIDFKLKPSTLRQWVSICPRSQVRLTKFACLPDALRRVSAGS